MSNKEMVTCEHTFNTFYLTRASFFMHFPAFPHSLRDKESFISHTVGKFAVECVNAQCGRALGESFS